METSYDPEPAEIQPRFLIVDDDPLIRRTFVRQFRDKGEVFEADSGEVAVEMLKEGLDVHIMLVDYLMPGMTGIDVFRQSSLLAPRTQRILITGAGAGDFVLDAINEGHIHHFVKKPWDPNELRSVFRQLFDAIAMERKNDLLMLELKYANTSLVRANEQLKKHKAMLEQSLDERTAELVRVNRELEQKNELLLAQAIRDSLTGLYNHATCVQRLEEEIARARRYNSSVSVLFCDIDHFKTYNDRCGHATGDTVLRCLAHFLVNGSMTVSPSRKSDIIGRYGGEEFVLILPETDKTGAMIRAMRLCDGVRSLDVPGVENQPLGCLSLSIGVATYPTDADNMNDLLAGADAAMYTAKASGRNQVVPATKPGR